MKRLKENKGITLIALIITIIVLLILAVVAISAVQGDGIIAHAKNARDNYKDTQDTENTILANYLVQLDNANNGITIEENESDENEESDSVVGTYYLYDPENYNTVTLVLKEDGTIGGNSIEFKYDAIDTRNLRWTEDKENNTISIEGEYEHEEKGSYIWEDLDEDDYLIFNIAGQKVIGCCEFYVSSLNCINNFTYLKEGKYVSDEDKEITISSITSGGYKFGLWTNSDGTETYFTDGNIIINPYGDVYHISGENEFTLDDNPTDVYRYVTE